MDKECNSPTFCPSDDGKYPSAEWQESSEPSVQGGRADGLIDALAPLGEGQSSMASVKNSASPPLNFTLFWL